MMKKLPHGRNSRQVSKEVIALLLPYMDRLKTITTDNGSEFADHQEITKRLNVPVFFYRPPYSSRQKGAVENANKLTRQYVPKRTSFKEYSTQNIKEIQYKLNRRPRKKLDFNAKLNLALSILHLKRPPLLRKPLILYVKVSRCG